MKHPWLAVTFGLVTCVGALYAKPTITAVTNESGESFLWRASVLLAMPAGSLGGLTVRPSVAPVGSREQS